MFIFHRRHRNGSADVFDICLPADAIKDATKRFGPALNFFMPNNDERYHLLGWVVLVSDEQQNNETGFYLACKNLFEAEKRTLYRELEMFVGKNCWTYGSKAEVGWFMTDSLK